MPEPESNPNAHIAVIGGGVIGQGWAAQLLARGRRVVVVDPQVTFEDVAGYVERSARALAALGDPLEDWRDRLTVTTDLEEALEGAGWVQENGPETPAIKSDLVRRIDAVLDPSVIIASSTSGTTASELAASCAVAPERVIVGHPFNPVHLIPLVEVVASPTTPDEVVERALTFYAGLGKRPIRVRAEVPGHVANRLQVALWREAYSLIERGIATAADIDTAISSGPGLRWALLGPLVNQHLSGGAGGLRHIFEHLGPPTQVWMDDLRDVRLTEQLAEQVSSSVDEELAAIDLPHLVADRDRLLVELLRAKATARNLP